MVLLAPFHPERRFIMFLAPCTVLAASAVMRTTQFSLAAGRSWTCGPGNLALVWRLLLVVCIGYVWSRYVFQGMQDLDGRWLRWIDAPLPRVLFLLATALCVAGSAGYCLSKKPQLVTWSVVTVFFAVNLALDGIWYASATFTLRDASQSLNAVVPKGCYMIGSYQHMLALENHVLPIQPPWCKKNEAEAMNYWFIEESERALVSPQCGRTGRRGRDASACSISAGQLSMGPRRHGAGLRSLPFSFFAVCLSMARPDLPRCCKGRRRQRKKSGTISRIGRRIKDRLRSDGPCSSLHG